MDISQKATAVAATHDPHGVPFLSVFTIPGTALLPLHEQIDVIEAKVRRACGGGTGPGRAWKPDVVAIEGTFTRMGGSDYPLHAIHACVKQWLYRRGIPYVDLSPKTLKMWATGSGNATKAEVVAAVLAAYGKAITINPADDNQADAVSALSMTLAGYGCPLAPVPSLPLRRDSHSRALNGRKWPAVDWGRL